MQLCMAYMRVMALWQSLCRSVAPCMHIHKDFTHHHRILEGTLGFAQALLGACQHGVAQTMQELCSIGSLTMC